VTLSLYIRQLYICANFLVLFFAIYVFNAHRKLEEYDDTDFLSNKRLIVDDPCFPGKSTSKDVCFVAGTNFWIVGHGKRCVSRVEIFLVYAVAYRIFINHVILNNTTRDQLRTFKGQCKEIFENIFSVCPE
jgi:hypothetical protein